MTDPIPYTAKEIDNFRQLGMHPRWLATVDDRQVVAERDALAAGVREVLAWWPVPWKALRALVAPGSGTPGEDTDVGCPASVSGACLQVTEGVDPRGVCSDGCEQTPEDTVAPVLDSDPGEDTAPAEHTHTTSFMGPFFCQACRAKLVKDGDGWACPRRIEAEADPAPANPVDELVRQMRAGLPPTVSPKSVEAIEGVLRQTYDALVNPDAAEPVCTTCNGTRHIDVSATASETATVNVPCPDCRPVGDLPGNQPRRRYVHPDPATQAQQVAADASARDTGNQP